MAAQTAQNFSKGTMDPVEVMHALQAPFDLIDVEFRVQRGVKTQKGDKAVVVAYITNRAIQKRLDELFTPLGWRNEFKEWRGESVLCGISIHWNGEWVTKWDGADTPGIEGTKGGFSAAQKRAAVQWGIGRYLYDLPEYWQDVRERGQFYINDQKSGVKGYWDSPVLPAWAIPEDKRKGNTPSSSTPRDKEESQTNDNVVSLPNRNGSNPAFTCALIAMRPGVAADDTGYWELIFQKDGRDAKFYATGDMYDQVSNMDLAEGSMYNIVSEKINGVYQLKSIEEVK
jgi:hypothetical protein